jgi:hypothetical protein
MNTPRLTRQIADGLVYIARTGDTAQAPKLAQMAQELDDSEELWNAARRGGLSGPRFRKLLLEQEERDRWIHVARRVG